LTVLLDRFSNKAESPVPLIVLYLSTETRTGVLLSATS
jgi:hypothetical protein